MKKLGVPQIRINIVIPTIVLIILFVILTILNPNFMSAYNIGALFDGAITYFIAGIGMTFVLLIGSIDLSVGSMISLDTILFILLANKLGVFAFPIILLIGGALGYINGYILTRFRIPSFIATFGMSGVYQSLALIFSGAGPVGFERTKINLIEFLSVQIGFLKVIHLFGIVLLVIFTVVLRYTAFGRNVYATGSSERATMLSGIDTQKIKLQCFMISGFAVALASIGLVSIKMSAAPSLGQPYQMNIIAATVVGGTSMSGGVGGVGLTYMGSLILSVLSNGLNMFGVNVYLQQIITGILTVVAISLTLDRTKVKIVK